MSWRSALDASGSTENVLAQTSLEKHAKRFQFGLYVRHRAVPTETCQDWAQTILNAWPRERSKVGMGHYAAWQAAKFPCTCHYSYAGASRHPLYAFGKRATAHADPINTVLNSIESFVTDSICRAGVPEPFNHAVINLYSVGSLMLTKKEHHHHRAHPPHDRHHHHHNHDNQVHASRHAPNNT